MADSLIAQYLNKILEAVYGKDVRQSIHNAIEQCYKDVNSPILNITAMKAAIQEKIDDGTIPNMTLADGSVTEEKMDPDFLKNLRGQSYVVGDDGKKYTIGIDIKGNIISKPYYEMPEEGLVCDIFMVKGAPYDAVTGKVFANGTAINDTDFKISEYQIAEQSYDEFSFVIYFNHTEAKSTSAVLLADGSNKNGKNMRIQYGSRINYNGLANSMYNWNSLGAAVTVNAVIGDAIANNGYELLAVSFKKDGTISIYQDNGYFKAEQKEGALPFTNPTIGWLSQGYPIRRISFYDRALSDDELFAIVQSVRSEDYTLVPSFKFLNGLVGISSPSAFARKGNMTPYFLSTDTSRGNHTYDFNEVERSWENTEYTPVTVNDDMSRIEELLWTHIKDEIEVEDIFACEAYPYPYDIHTTKYNVEYESSNPSVIECIKGVLFAKQEGKAVITAKLSNSTLTCSKEITVIPKRTLNENFLYLSQNYSSGLNSMDSENPRAVAAAIRSAVTEAKAAGYNGIVFPQDEYDVRFDDCDENNVFIQIPSDFTIDFNNSVWNIQERADISTRGVTIFGFGRMKEKEPEAEGTYGDWEICKNSVVKNLTIYGERCTKDYSTAEAKGDQLAKFSASSRNCSLINIYAEGMTGWITDANCSDYNYWTGKGDGDNRRGRTLYTDYVSGKLDETGAEVVPDSTGVWYCTPEYLKTGYVYGKDSIKSNEMDKYVFGFMGIVTYGNPGRWYDIYFFDEEKKLISYNPKQFGLEPYQYPENAVYFKVNVPLGEAPTKNGGEDNCLIRLYPYMEAEHIVFENCKFVNPQYTSFSMTGGRDCIIRDCYCEQGNVAGWGWAVDWEDGWQTMRHNIHYHLITNGNVVFPGSHHNCLISCFINGSLTVSNDTEDVIAINNVIRSGNIKAKTNNAIMYNYYRDSLSYSSASDNATNRDLSNAKIDDYNNFIFTA